MSNVMSVCYDSQACIKCFACSIACGVENRVRLQNKTGYGVDKSSQEAMSHLNFIKPTVSESGTFPNVTQITAMHHCKHCQKSKCGDVCPTQAITKDKTRIVTINPDLCVGCGACRTACPFDVPRLSPEIGKTFKCTMCKDRLTNGMKTACTMACPSVAIFSGSRAEVLAEAKQRAEHYTETFGKKFIVYGADEVSSHVGDLGYLSIVPEEYQEELLAPVNPQSVIPNAQLGVKASRVAATALGVGIAAHAIHWQLNKEKSEMYHTDNED